MTVAGYRVLRQVGSGGSGKVYRAIDNEGNIVALKLLDLPMDAAATRRVRFNRERQALAGIRHLNVARFIEAGEHAADGGFLAMEFVDGKTLRAHAQPLLPEAAILIGTALCGGLSALHKAGVVHRDIKPDNVMLTPQGRVVLVDLGLALHGEGPRVTTEGAALGSIPYMSPEQIDGMPLGPSTDVWSLGVTLYELCSASRPFARGSTSEEVAAILATSFVPLRQAQPRVGTRLSELVSECLQGNPRLRPDAAQVESRLAAMVDWIPASAIPSRLFSFVDERATFEDDVMRFRVAAALDAAGAALDGGDSNRAIEVLERGLAYEPSSAELAACLDELVRGRSSPTAPPTAISAQSTRGVSKHDDNEVSRGWMVGLVGMVGLAGLAGIGALAAGIVAPDDGQIGSEAAAKLGTDDGTDASTADGPDMTRPLSNDPSTLPDSTAAPILTAFPSVPAIAPSSLPSEGPRDRLKVYPTDQPLFSPDRFTAGTPRAAIADYERQLEVKRDVPTMVGRAMAMLANNDRNGGLAELRRLRDAHPAHSLVFEASGLIVSRMGDTERAEVYLTRAIELSPHNPKVRGNRGILRHKAGNIKGAYEDLIAAVNANPDLVDALKELAALYDRQGYRHDAAPLLEHVLKFERTNPDLWFDLSLARVDPRESLAAARRGLALSAHSPRGKAYECAALVQLRHADALAACTRARQLDRGNESVRTNLKWARDLASDTP